ncbi:MAG: hypothetical protein IJN61_03705 [Clostridia bacterium]|nr:hypothetical protein [Clostridia bacterium]
MRQKIYKVLNTLYGILMSASFFAGFLPLIPFLVAIIIGGDAGESMAVFLSKQYYPWVIIVGSIALVIGLIAMYVGKLEALSVKKVSADPTPDETEK